MNEKRILVVDDEALIRRAVADYLAECGYETDTAADGAEGLARARSEKFHAVLVDLRMPYADGLEVIATLKVEQPELPVVVVSGTGVLADAVEAMRRGAWDYVTKPIKDMDEIAVVVGRVLERAQLIAERDRYQHELEQLNRSLKAEVDRQVQDLKIQYRELAALNSVSYAISGPLDLDTMLNRAIDAAVAAIEADGGIIRLLNPATSQLVVAAARGLPESYLASAQGIPLGQGIAGQVVQSGYPCTGEDFAGDPWLASLSETTGLRSYLYVPLRAGEETLWPARKGGLLEGAEKPLKANKKHSIVGALGVAMRAKRDFGTREVELLAAIGNQVGVAVARAQYAAELEQANAELRRLDVLREQFIQNVAHELRTPLALVHGYVQLLTQDDVSPEEQKIAIKVASRHVQALVGLVESITTLQDLGIGPLNVEKITPAELLQTACQMAAQRAVSTGVELRSICPPDLPPFLGDFARLVQALHQLLDNACKFSPKGSTVTVAAQVAPAEEAMVISVTDQGIGIPPEEHARIFNRFYQVDGSTTRRYGGTGLGLALAKEIVEAHGGTITVQSEPGEGSTFTIMVPLRKE